MTLLSLAVLSIKPSMLLQRRSKCISATPSKHFADKMTSIICLSFERERLLIQLNEETANSTIWLSIESK